MLRIAVISLLVANLLLLGFQGSKPAVEPETIAKQSAVEDSSVPTIHLFSEMIEDQDLLSGNRRCFSLGPFHSPEDKNEIRTLLEEVSANISERETQALVEKGYWVYMPPYESLLESNQVLLSLQALGLKDIGVIYNGDWNNAISLGYFLRQENALRRQKDLEDRNFAPRIRVQRQSESRYWLDYEQNPGSALITIDMQDRPNDFMRRSLPCPEQDPFEIIAPVSENLAAEVKQPPTQIPVAEPQSPPVENIEPESEEIIERQPEETIEQQPEETIEQQPEEIIEQQPVEEDGLQSEEDDVLQPAEEIDLDFKEGLDTVSIDTSEVEVPGPAIGTELQNSNETEPEVSENLEDDTLQQQVETPEEGFVPQPIQDDAVDPEGNIDSAPVDSENTELEPAIETETESSVGTGPVIGFGTQPEEGDDTQPEEDDDTQPEKDDGTQLEEGNEIAPEVDDETETDDG